MRETVTMEDFDHVFMNVQEAILSHHQNTLVVISGREGKDTEKMLNLQQEKSLQVDEEPVVTDDSGVTPAPEPVVPVVEPERKV